MRDAVQGSSVHIQKKAGGTVTFGRKLAPEGSLSHRLAKAARGFPIVCVLALDTSAALAQPSVTQAPASDASTMAYSPQRHDALIAARREGRVTPAQALQQLEAWLASPLGEAERRRAASDALVVAVADGQFAEAVALARRFPPAGLSDYALGPLTVAARRTKDLALQGDTVKLWRARQPDAREPRIHEAYWRLDSGDISGAKAIYTALAAQPSKQIDDRVSLLELRAAVARADNDPLQALAAYTEAGALRPERPDLRREGDFLLAGSGAASSAFDDAEAAERATPGSFSPLALSTLQQEALGQQLRWAIQERDQRLGAERVVALDRVLAAQEVRGRNTQVLAPDDGVISARTATVGSVVAAGTELFRLIRQGRLEWRAEVTSAELSRIAVGTPAFVVSASGAQVRGKVRSIAPTVDPQTRAALVYVDLPAVQQNTGIKAGMFARGDFELGRSSAPTVPQSAIVPRDGFNNVFLLKPDNKVMQLKVQVGRRLNDRIEITSALPEGAQVVVQGAGFLNDGDLVRVVEAPAQPARPAASAPASAAAAK